MIGFDVNVSNNNVTPDYRSQVTWNSPTTNIYADAALWGTLQLQPSGLFSQVLDATVPALPKNLNYTEDKSKVTITWDASSDNIVVDKYIVTYGDEKDTLVALETDNMFTTDSLADGDYTFEVVAVDPSGNKSGRATVNVTISTTSPAGVKSVNSESLTFYPNPATNFIYLKDVESGAVIKFYSITGQNVLTTTARDGRIDIRSLKDGIYIMNLQSGSNVFVTKMIKK